MRDRLIELIQKEVPRPKADSLVNSILSDGWIRLHQRGSRRKVKGVEVMSICKDCFHSYVCEQFNEHREWDNKKCHFANDHFASVADVVKVVRCKDCEHYHKGKESTVCDYDYCDILYYCDGSHRTACEEDFCSYGKLKEREKV